MDFKYHVSDAKKIAKSLVAFSNVNGGSLLLGVKDNGKIIGVESEEEAYMIGTAADRYCSPKIEDYEIKEWWIDDKVVLEVIIPPGKQKPYYHKNEQDQWRVYIRIHDENKLANRIIVQVMKRQNRPQGTEIYFKDKEKAILHYLENNEKADLEGLQSLIGLNKRKTENILINLISIGLVDVVLDKHDFVYQLQHTY